MNIVTTPLTQKDFATDQEVRWCPGCGDYAILKAVQRTLADIGADPVNSVFVSGIGCAARFPYYMETYGFHTIHGRAAAIATGTKVANPQLDVWLVSGDGDSLSIGGNHLLHLLRRNVDLVYLLFNNEIYGLTKGQASPTSRLGTRSPSTPSGSLDQPVHAASFALGAGASFVARGIDVSQKHLLTLLKRAHAHKGTSFVEILQNCYVYNPGIYDPQTDKKTSADHVLELEHGAPMIFGKNRDKGIVLDRASLSLRVAELGENSGGEDSVGEADILVHDETNPALAHLIATIDGPDMPTPVGVIFARQQPTFESHCRAPERDPAEVRGKLGEMLASGHTWRVE
jgi:2-oxoglutarate ferredoxin oxidoreductase subunit beta